MRLCEVNLLIGRLRAIASEVEDLEVGELESELFHLLMRGNHTTDERDEILNNLRIARSFLSLKNLIENGGVFI